MLEERLQNTKKSLERLALQTGKSLEDILKYLTQTDFSQIKNENMPSSKSFEDYFKSRNRAVKKSSFCDSIPGDQNGEFLKNVQIEKNKEITILQKTMENLESSILQLNKISTSIMENVVQQMVTKKIYKIRQNFRDLILSLLGIQQFAFYASYSSGRVQFQDFSSNFITQIMETDTNYSLLQKIINSAPSQLTFININGNSDFINLFQLHQNQICNGKYFALTAKQGSSQDPNNFSYCLLIKSQSKTIKDIKDQLISKLINKIIQISQINTSQESIYLTSKIYTKKMLDLLQILLVQCEVKLKKNLFSLCKAKTQIFYSITNIVKIILSKQDEHYANQQTIFLVRKLAGQFQQSQYKKIEQIRMYKKHVRENNNILLQFNRVGVLQFISGNKDSFYLNQLTKIWEEGRPVLDQLFAKNQKFDNYVKKAVRGSLKSDRPLQIAPGIKSKITTNGKRIQKIQIIIEDIDNSNQGSNMEIPAAILEKQSCQKQNRDDKSYRFRTIKQIQKQCPGLSKQGWLDLFLQGKPHNQLNLRSNSLSKKNNTLTIQNTQAKIFNPKLLRQLSYVMPKQKYEVKIDDIVIDNPNLNFLQFSEEQLEIFAIKVLNSLDYFQRLPQQKSKLANFISELHDNYEIHSNPFHNFKHGINVMHACYLLGTMPANLNVLSVRDIFAVVFSGLCHDVGHTGFTNAFQIASLSKKALTYNDKSPLQNFHVSLTFEILKKDKNNFLCHMERQEFIAFRKSVIENILFTDIKEHFPMLNNFNEVLKSGKILGRQDASLLSTMIIHASDFAGSVKQFEICKAWSHRVNQQFSNQYKVEGQIGIPQTPFMKDLTNPIVLSKAQGGFLRVIVYPLYQALDKFYITEGIAHKFKKNIQQNIKAWEEINRIQTQKAKGIEELQKKQ